jgi:uncharacterized alpha-E superfamily protein
MSSMLSSVAERLYWMARYLERAESMACLTNAYTQFILDVPRGTQPGWDSLIRIIEGEAAFSARYTEYTERNVLKFLIADIENAGSIRYAIRAARENIRTTRGALPEQCWELLNALHLYVSENAESSIARRHRFHFLDRIVARLQQTTGLIASSVPRDHAYQFIRIGRLIERCDMTSRVVDVATATTLGRQNPSAPEVTWLWAILLKSLSAVSAYRREAGPVVDGSEVIDFVFKSEVFPRSVYFCLDNIVMEAEQLQHNEAVLDVIDQSKKLVRKLDAEAMTLTELHTFIDRLQARLIALHGHVSATWFIR